MRDVHVQSLKEVSKELVDPYAVIEDEVGRFTKILYKLGIYLSLEIFFLLLLHLHPHNEVHRTQHNPRHRKLIDINERVNFLD